MADTITLDLVNYLVDLLTAKNSLGIASADVTSDSSVLLLINGVSKWIKNKTGRQLRQSAIVEYRDGNGLDEMALKSPPAVSTRVYIDPSLEFADDTEVNTSSMIIDSVTGTITLKSKLFTRGHKTIKITYTGGYADPVNDCADLAEAALFMIKKLWDPKDGLVSSVSIQGGNVAYFDSVAPKWVLDVIGRYKPEL